MVKMIIDPNKILSSSIVLERLSQIMAPILMVFAFYTQFHGDLSPGGGFQAGCLIAVVYYLYAFLFGFDWTYRVFPEIIFKCLIVLGALIYLLTGFLTILLGGNYLEYAVFGELGQEYGLLIIEFGVMLAVSSALIIIVTQFYNLVLKKDNS